MSTKLCKDCKHYVKRDFGPVIFGIRLFHIYDATLDKCNALPDPVTGEPGEYCDIARMSFGTCGRGGTLFEAKEEVTA